MEVQQQIENAITLMINQRLSRPSHSIPAPSFDPGDLTDEQAEGITRSLSHNLSLYTGGPGTGKSYTLKRLTGILESHGARVNLMAPTGRAAQRMRDITGIQATTIHRGLGYNPEKGFNKHEYNRLDADFVVVDEMSMVDSLLFYHLLKSLPQGTQLLLVGDKDQLSSVGYGHVGKRSLFQYCLDEARLNTTTLTRLFRQAQASKIVHAAHSINRGEVPDLKNGRGDNFFFHECNDPLQAQDLITDLVTRRLPKAYGVDALRDIQVLSPMYKGLVGVDALNARIGTHVIGQAGIVEGAKVMQLKNNYKKGVMNGNTGYVKRSDRMGVLVEFQDEYGPLLVHYVAEEIQEIKLAYACTVHKSQGSEYPIVVIPVFRDQRMWTRRLLYTAVTRAKQVCILVGERSAIERAVQRGD